MPLHYCDFDGCGKPSVRQTGSCRICGQHMCATHSSPLHHTCPRWEDNHDAWAVASEQAEREEIASLISRIDTQGLRNRASALRSGVACTLSGLTYSEELKWSVMGGKNYHVTVEFEDGISWIYRIRRQNADTPPVALQDKMLMSEAATLRVLADTGIPVPKVYDYWLNSPDSPAGIGYILMEKLPGKSLYSEWYDLSEETKGKILSQLADIFVRLSTITFHSIGCLISPEDLSMGPLVAEEMADVDALGGGLSLLGPFPSCHEYRSALIARQLERIRSGEVYKNATVNAYLVHRWLLDFLPTLRDREPGDQGLFYMKNVDDKGDHILVDGEGCITGLIDWEWAQTTSKEEAFCAPMFLIDVAAYYEARNELSQDEAMFVKILEQKGLHELASLARKGRVHHRLAHCLSGEVEDEAVFPYLFAGFLAALEGKNPKEPAKMWEEWRELAMERYKDDEGLRELLSRS